MARADTSPKVPRPTVTALSLRVTGCGLGQVQVERLEIGAGLLRMVSNKAGKTKDTGIPGSIKLEVRPVNTTGSAPSRCSWSLLGKTGANATRSYKFSGCTSCGHCLKKMGFKCGAPYLVRVQAKGRGKKVLPSDWSQDLEWKAVCEGDAGTACYNG